MTEVFPVNSMDETPIPIRGTSRTWRDLCYLSASPWIPMAPGQEP
jgi:hypothetical protein